MSRTPWVAPPSPRGYHEVLEAVMRHGVEQRNARTGHAVLAVPHLRWTHDMGVIAGRNELPLAGLRKVSLKTSAAELAWMLQGTRSLKWLQKYTKMWDQFATSERAMFDGAVPSKDIIEAAYGWRWRSAFGRDQVQMAIAALRTDPTSRQVHVATWNPAIDGLGDRNAPAKNVPCILGFTVSVIADNVHVSVDLRSSDVVVGLPYDMLTFALLTDALALTLGLNPGLVTLNLAHAHVYDVHWDAARDMLVGPMGVADHRNPLVPAWTLSAIEEDPDGYVSMVQSLPHTQTDRYPRLEVVT